MPLGNPAMGGKAWIARKPRLVILPGWLRGPGWQGNSVYGLLAIGGSSSYSSFPSWGFGYSRFWKVLLPKVGCVMNFPNIEVLQDQFPNNPK
jgi:hypothetical protein